MHIKSLTIQGFKSYRDQVVVDPFSERVNICVGRNGAGKSNFFSAIRFVLADAYSTLGRQERQSLLHEGSSATATFSAFVEIVFDNSDGRIPTGKDEVVLRRTIGSKKDDYSLDRKSTSKAEVLSLLESAGFSRSNPFFIVPQGRITSLTNQKDPERLELLKEIAGTRVYEDRRAESTRIMEETDQKRKKIDELLEFIGRRLEELEEEKKELKEFQTADKERRILEYCIYQHDLDEAKEMLNKIETDRLNDQAAAAERQDQAQEREKAISALEAEIAELEEQRELLNLAKQQDEAEKREAIKARTQVELLIKDLEDTSERNAGLRQELQANIDELEGEVSEKEAELTAVQPRYEQAQQKENEAQKLLEQAEAKQKSLFDKQGRAGQYRTQKERDAFLARSIQESKAFLQSREKSLEDIERNIGNVSNNLDQYKARQEEIKKQLEDAKSSVGVQQKELDRITAQKAELEERRKGIWKEDEKLNQTIAHAGDEKRKAEKSLNSMMDQATQQGLNTVRHVAENLGLSERVYGPLYELFEVDEMFRTAVEQIAGNSLFHIVVDNDDTASRILDVMVKEKKGRVTFMPLNRLKPRRVTYPDQQEEAVPLISKLRYRALYKSAIEQVFNQAIMVQDLHIGNIYSRTHGLTAITLNGDKQERKGSMTGGYFDSKRSRLEAARQLKQWSGKWDTDRTRQIQLRGERNTLDQQITGLLGEIQKLETRIRRLREEREPLSQELESLSREREQGTERLERLQEAKKDNESEREATKVQLQAYEEEMRTPMRDALTSEETDMLTRLATEIQKRKKEARELNKDKQSLATKKSLIEIELNQNLRRKLAKLRGQLDSLVDTSAGQEGGQSSTQANASLIARRAELSALVRNITVLSEKTSKLEAEVEECSTDLVKKHKQLETEQARSAEESRGLARQQKNVERYLAKRQILLQRRDDSSQKIRDLGVLPEDAYIRHAENHSTEKLYKKLHKIHDTLKKFTSVNKKAVDQYSEFTSQRTQLTARREELDKSAESIEELIQVLDQRKDEAIERTFKQVSRNFQEVFERLVPQGRGRLIMQKRSGNDEDEEEEEEEVGDNDEDEEEQIEEDHEDEDSEGSEEGEDEEMDENEDDEPAAKRAKKGKSTSKASKSKSKPKEKGKSKATTGKSTKSTSKSKSKGKGKASIPAPGASRISSYTGISIKVSFNSKSDEGLRIQQLSGGQKSIVALTLIFAIQKCDPAPFYLFDEIDANLDADRRTAVAAMIRSLSESAQFIITTFRPELLSEGDTFLGVIFDNRKISSIKKIKQEEAYEFVDTMAGVGAGASAGVGAGAGSVAGDGSSIA